MENLAEIASALQGESHTSETLAWSEQLHAADIHFSSSLQNREINNEVRRSNEIRELEAKLVKRSLQVELDIGRRDATRDSVILRASSVGNVLVALAVMIGCAFMFVYQIQLPVPVPDSPEFYNFTIDFSASSSSSSTATLLEQHSAAIQERYKNFKSVAHDHSGGDVALFFHALFLWLSIAVLATALWAGLLVHLRLKRYSVHRPLLVYECGHVHSLFGSYYKCRCLELDLAMRRMFLGGTLFLIASSCVSSWEISVVSFGRLSAGVLFLVPVCLAIVVVVVGAVAFDLEETAHPSMLRRRGGGGDNDSDDAKTKNNDHADNNKQRAAGDNQTVTVSKKRGGGAGNASRRNSRYLLRSVGAAGGAGGGGGGGGGGVSVPPRFMPVDGGATVIAGEMSSRHTSTASGASHNDERDLQSDDDDAERSESTRSVEGSDDDDDDDEDDDEQHHEDDSAVVAVKRRFHDVMLKVDLRGGDDSSSSASSYRHGTASSARAAVVGVDGTVVSKKMQHMPEQFLCPKLLKRHNKLLVKHRKRVRMHEQQQHQQQHENSHVKHQQQQSLLLPHDVSEHPQDFLDRNRYHMHYLRAPPTGRRQVVAAAADDDDDDDDDAGDEEEDGQFELCSMESTSGCESSSSACSVEGSSVGRPGKATDCRSMSTISD